MFLVYPCPTLCYSVHCIFFFYTPIPLLSFYLRIKVKLVLNFLFFYLLLLSAVIITSLLGLLIFSWYHILAVLLFIIIMNPKILSPTAFNYRSLLITGSVPLLLFLWFLSSSCPFLTFERENVLVKINISIHIHPHISFFFMPFHRLFLFSTF